MRASFLNHDQALLTVMLQFETPEAAAEHIKNGLRLCGEAFGLQVESLLPEYQNKETYQKLFAQMEGRPSYVTNYRSIHNTGKTDEELAEGLVTLAQSGATLCDVMGDLFCKHPEEMTDNEEAIQKQMALIEKLHALGAEVLMSSHILKFTPAERVLEVALEQKRRGADIIKIVTGADTMEQQLENLRITNLLKEKLDAPFLFLSGGECTIHRRLGYHLGCSMILCVYAHHPMSTPTQPLLTTMKTIRDQLDF